ncbi:SCO family protein [Pseudogracilibacillus sp. SE30717A]|uniref:SCO family protein n=1 Tax=Pseudogracilibacillus sp. SE30717A TaxID=3098293 RepID=UPI00300E5B8C
MRKWINLSLILTLVVILGACGGNKVETNMSDPVEDFSATTQDGNTLTRDDLEGKWWVADFIFTNCTTVCLPMTSNMKKLQDKLDEAGVKNYHLVSFSVDPEFDTPEVLTEYAEQYEADLSTWSFLTGYDFDYIKDLSVNSFKSLVAPPPEGEDQVSHGTSFFLVNPEGEIIKHYKGTEADQMDQIAEDLKNLQ